MIVAGVYILIGLGLIVYAVSKSCEISGHNFIDRGKYFYCTKCHAAIIKKRRD